MPVDFAFAPSDRLQDVAQVLVRHFGIKIFDRLEQTAILVAVEDDFRAGNHHFVAFPAHLFDEDGDLHFAARIDLEGAGGLSVVDLRAKRCRGSRG